MSDRERKLIDEAAALWMANALYLDDGGNYRWHRNARRARRVAVPWNRVVKKYRVDLHMLGHEIGFADRDYRNRFLREHKLNKELLG